MTAYEIPERDVTVIDENEGNVTLRIAYEAGTFYRAEVFVGGWRVGFYKTEAGARRAFVRHASQQGEKP